MQRRSERRNSHQGNVLKGLVAGIIGGLVASWTMDQFQALSSKLSEADKGGQGKQDSSQHSDQKGGQQKQEQSGEKQEPATVKAAEAISKNVFDHQLTKSEKDPAGNAVHYATGAVTGAIYGIAAELMPVAAAGAGLPFGAMVWLIVDEAAVPALGLSKSPREYPLSTHASALASHFVYGLTTDIVRRAVRRAL